jgi:hypothetical protein
MADQPRTGNGKDDGRKPSNTELAQRNKDGVRLLHVQPDPKWQRAADETANDTR